MAYTATVSTPLNKCERISPSLGVLAGKVSVSSYNTTLTTITGITKYFVTGSVAGFTQGIVAVIPSGLSDSGYGFQWDYTTGAFKCYTPTVATTHAVNLTLGTTGGAVVWSSAEGLQVSGTSGSFNVVASVAAPGSEAANDTDCGTISFVAIGFIR